MIFVYIKNGWVIAKEKRERYDINYDEVIISDNNISDLLVYEDGIIKKYNESNQYKIDKWIEWLEEKNKRLEKELRNEKILTEDLMKRHIRLKTEFDLLRTKTPND